MARMMYYLITFRGLSRGEACGLCWSDVDLESAVLRREVPRPRYELADRIWFAALSRQLPSRRLVPALLPPVRQWWNHHMQ